MTMTNTTSKINMKAWVTVLLIFMPFAQHTVQYARNICYEEGYLNIYDYFCENTSFIESCNCCSWKNNGVRVLGKCHSHHCYHSSQYYTPFKAAHTLQHDVTYNGILRHKNGHVMCKSRTFFSTSFVAFAQDEVTVTEPADTDAPDEESSLDVIGITIGAIVGTLFIILILSGIFCRKQCFGSPHRPDDKPDSDERSLTSRGRVSPTSSPLSKETETPTNGGKTSNTIVRSDSRQTPQLQVKPIDKTQQNDLSKSENGKSTRQGNLSDSNPESRASHRDERVKTQTPRGNRATHNVATPRDITLKPAKLVYIP